MKLGDSRGGNRLDPPGVNIGGEWITGRCPENNRVVELEDPNGIFGILFDLWNPRGAELFELLVLGWLARFKRLEGDPDTSPFVLPIGKSNGFLVEAKLCSNGFGSKFKDDTGLLGSFAVDAVAEVAVTLLLDAEPLSAIVIIIATKTKYKNTSY